METEFAERLIRARQERGYTQQKLAEKLGVTSQAVSKWETGASLPDIVMVKSIAILLDCSIDYFMGHEPNQDGRVRLETLERKNELEKIIQKEIIEFRVGIGLTDMLVQEMKQGYQLVHELRKRIAMRYGVPVPVIRLMDDISLREKEYQILLHGKVLLASAQVEYPNFFYFSKEGTALEPIWEQKGEWKPREALQKEQEEEKDLPAPVSAMQIAMLHLEQVIVKNYDKILNRQMVADLVEITRRKYPAAVEGVVPEKISYALLQKVVAGLVMKGDGIVSMEVLIEILEDALGEMQGQGAWPNAGDLIERAQKEQRTLFPMP